MKEVEKKTLSNNHIDIIKRTQYFYDDNGNEYWYGEDKKKHYTKDEG